MRGRRTGIPNEARAGRPRQNGRLHATTPLSNSDIPGAEQRGAPPERPARQAPHEVRIEARSNKKHCAAGGSLMATTAGQLAMAIQNESSASRAPNMLADLHACMFTPDSATATVQRKDVERNEVIDLPPPAVKTVKTQCERAAPPSAGRRTPTPTCQCQGGPISVRRPERFLSRTDRLGTLQPCLAMRGMGAGSSRRLAGTAFTAYASWGCTQGLPAVTRCPLPPTIRCGPIHPPSQTHAHSHSHIVPCTSAGYDLQALCKISTTYLASCRPKLPRACRRSARRWALNPRCRTMCRRSGRDVRAGADLSPKFGRARHKIGRKRARPPDLWPNPAHTWPHPEFGRRRPISNQAVTTALHQEHCLGLARDRTTASRSSKARH